MNVQTLPALTTKTPDKVTSAIVALARKLIVDGELAFIPVQPIAGAQPNDCVASVGRQVELNGGSIVYGWRIHEWPMVLVEAEFHAAWEDPEGRLIDVSHQTRGAQRTLFLPDPGMEYDGRQRDNVRVPLREGAVVRNLIRACEDEFELQNRGDRAWQQEVRLSGADAQEYHDIQRRKMEATAEILSTPAKQVGRNEPCPCGSGDKFKRCCMRRGQ